MPVALQEHPSGRAATAATSASGQLAMVGHRRNRETGRDDHSTLTVLTFDGEGIAAVAAFMGQDIPRSGLISEGAD